MELVAVEEWVQMERGKQLERSGVCSYRGDQMKMEWSQLLRGWLGLAGPHQTVHMYLFKKRC